MPNYDDLSKYLVVESNGTLLLPFGSLSIGNSTVNTTINSTGHFISDVNGVLSINSTSTASNTAVVNTASNTGFVTLSNNLKMNFGFANANTTGTLITLQSAFTSNLLSAQATTNNIATTAHITTANTTKITITANSIANALVYWTALGI